MLISRPHLIFDIILTCNMTERVQPTDFAVDPERLLGLSTIDIAKCIVRTNQDIAVVHFRAYHYVPNTPSGPGERIFPIKRNDFLHGYDLAAIIDSLDDGFNLALDSKIILESGDTAHFQMIDLAPRKSPEALEKITSRFREIIVPRFGGGVLLETNKSYHYFGFQVLSPEEWLDFLGLNLITSIVTQVDENLPRVHEFISDYRYIGHSILRRSTGLRVTTIGSKTFEPKVVSVIV